MIRLKSLKQKLAILVLLPLCLIMLIAGTLGMRLISNVLLKQWEETAISKMQRSAHNVDMRLMRPKELFRFFQQNIQKQLSWRDAQLLIAQLRAIDGVVDVKYNFLENSQHPMGGMYSLKKTVISSIGYDTKLKGQTVSIVALFIDTEKKSESHIEVVLEFYDLVEQIVDAPWWKGNKAFLLGPEGNILASTERGPKGIAKSSEDQEVFKIKNTFEAETWAAILQRSSGTVFSKGTPPAMVSGFYRLKEAPWTIVVMAAGTSVLHPILTFKRYYYILCAFGILCVLVYLWVITGKVTISINRLSTAANKLAEGTFSAPLLIESKDEIGDLTHSFNIMSKQLRERIELRKEMTLAGEVQNNLLPQVGFAGEGLDIAVLTKYCDETGGDYVDIINTSKIDSRATVVVGDVVGHGIGASLLMTTLRALLRGRAVMGGSSADIMKDVNSLLCRDTLRTGNFATLFYLTIDSKKRVLEWIRCGHEPALVYCTIQNSFTELVGTGLALGVDSEFKSAINNCDFVSENQIILIGTDGLWDVENSLGVQFGKKRTQELIVKYSSLSAKEITNIILEEIDLFRDGQAQADDITLAIIKTQVTP